MSTGLGTNATSGAALPYLKVPTSLYASGSCGVFATPVVAQASGLASIFTLYAALDVLGINFRGMLLAVYPDAGGAPGSPPLFDGLLSASMCWQQSGGGDNASAYGFAPNSTHWPNTGVRERGTTNRGTARHLPLRSVPTPRRSPRSPRRSCPATSPAVSVFLVKLSP